MTEVYPVRPPVGKERLEMSTWFPIECSPNFGLSTVVAFTAACPYGKGYMSIGNHLDICRRKDWKCEGGFPSTFTLYCRGKQL